MTLPIIDLYAGPGGWSEGLRPLGLTDLGIEWDADACRTRTHAGHPTIRADLAHYPPPTHLTGRCALIASPPCPTFSTAGGGEGTAEIPRLAEQCYTGTWSPAGLDDRTRHVLVVGRWIDDLRPVWVALEQVPAVLPVWSALAHRLRACGYSAWAGVLCAADSGVPQTRRRAILMASTERPVSAPLPSHAEHPGLFGELPWISMADALGWGRPQPSRTVCGHRTPRWLYADPDGTRGDMVLDLRTNTTAAGGAVIPRSPVPVDRPAPTLTCEGASGQWVFRHPDEEDNVQNNIRLTVEEALTLQSFRPDYPLAGTKTSKMAQIGNAMPPRFATHILAALTQKEDRP